MSLSIFLGMFNNSGSGHVENMDTVPEEADHGNPVDQFVDEYFVPNLEQDDNAKVAQQPQSKDHPLLLLGATDGLDNMKTGIDEGVAAVKSRKLPSTDPTGKKDYVYVRQWDDYGKPMDAFVDDCCVSEPPQHANMCEAHGLKMCNRMLNGKSKKNPCSNMACWEKSNLCHDEQCCHNRSRQRPSPAERKAARALKRQAKAELQNLDPDEIAERANESNRDLGFKRRAMEELRASNPMLHPDECRATVVSRLKQLMENSDAASCIQGLAREALTVWRC